nr:MAG TPA: hypothetical protein [Herelleviridae sp.]
MSFCLFVRIGKKICTFRRNIRYVIMLLFSIPSARESRRDFHIFVTKRFSNGTILLCNKK